MSITKSYNKHTDTYYAYDTTYVWDETLQKKVQKKVCVGKFDPETGEIIPNARRGRPPKNNPTAGRKTLSESKSQQCDIPSIRGELSALNSEIHDIGQSLAGLVAKLQFLEGRVRKMQALLSEKQE